MIDLLHVSFLRLNDLLALRSYLERSWRPKLTGTWPDPVYMRLLTYIHEHSYSMC